MLKDGALAEKLFGFTLVQPDQYQAFKNGLQERIQAGDTIRHWLESYQPHMPVTADDDLLVMEPMTGIQKKAMTVAQGLGSGKIFFVVSDEFTDPVKARKVSVRLQELSTKTEHGVTAEPQVEAIMLCVRPDVTSDHLAKKGEQIIDTLYAMFSEDVPYIRPSEYSKDDINAISTEIALSYPAGSHIGILLGRISTQNSEIAINLPGVGRFPHSR